MDERQPERIESVDRIESGAGSEFTILVLDGIVVGTEYREAAKAAAISERQRLRIEQLIYDKGWISE